MRGVFLDRDGVINQYRSDYVRSFDDFVYYDFVPAAFARLGTLGLPIAVITNQSGIARGYQPRSEVDATHDKFVADAKSWGADIGAIEICPHLPTDACSCRKPGTAMFELAAARLGVTLAGSYMVGDSPADMLAGHRLSMVTIRVATGRGAEGIVDGNERGEHDDYRVADLLAAVEQIEILERER